ncbi:MAG: hypothetical protein Q8R38_00095 [Candidatus Omnitrophota bacterium]|nr:hypothetical protein [Candidatus Omnitrophota bacterium]
MNKIKPIYWKLLVAAGVVYIIFTTITLVDICLRIGAIEHSLIHENTEHGSKH